MTTQHPAHEELLPMPVEIVSTAITAVAFTAAEVLENAAWGEDLDFG